MTRLWLVARHEYRVSVASKGFVLAVLSLPLLILLLIGLISLTDRLNSNYKPVGYMDGSGILSRATPAPARARTRDQAPPILFMDEASAQAALLAGDIQGYYVLPADYPQSRQVRLVYQGKSPSDSATGQFLDFLQVNMLAHWPADIAHRAAEGTRVVVRLASGDQTFDRGGPTLSDFAPLLVAGASVLLIFVTSGYLMGAVLRERENRMTEVLATSLSPGQIMAGKVVGITLLGLTQMAVWVLFALIATVIYAGGLNLGPIWGSINWRNIWFVALIALPTYVFYGALMATIGATFADVQETQQIASFLVMPFFLSIGLMAPIAQSPNGPLARALSFFPFTMLATLGVRSIFVTVPWWQIAVSSAVQVTCALGAIWLAGFAFRVGMLRYGQRVRLREILARRHRDG